MSNNQYVPPPMITRFQLWDPNLLKELTANLYAHLTRALNYTPNEDGAYPPECSHKECTSGKCWGESQAFLTKRRLDAEVVLELLQTDFNLPAACERDLIHTYRLEEVLREIDYQRTAL